MRKGVTIRLACMLLVTLMPVLPGADRKAPVDNLKIMSTLNYGIYWAKIWSPGFGSIDYHREIERTLAMYNAVISTLKEKGHSLFSADPIKQPRISGDNIDVIKKNIKEPSSVHLAHLYDINDNFKNLLSIFKVGSNVYFLLNQSMNRSKIALNGIYRINNEKWYDPVKGTKFDLAIDMGKDRALGYYLDRPLLLFGFNGSFSDDFSIPLPDFKFRQELYKLNEKKFLFHNVRLNPGAYAVEIYNLKGERTVECFDYTPYSMKSGYNELLTAQTVLTTDRRGYFYIGFQYPENPYRIWKYNENGLKVAVLGNYFEDPDIYEFPEEWLKWKATEIEYYGINRLYAVEKLLIDGQGRLFVVFSIDRISRKHRGEDTHKCFIDMYSEKGDFLDRFEFKYGIPQLIDQDIIYSRIETSPGSWKITVVRLSID